MTGNLEPGQDRAAREPAPAAASEAGPTGHDVPSPESQTASRLSEQLESWMGGDGPRTLGSLVDVFADKSFAVLLLVLLAVPALPAPTGGVTHVMELIAGLVAVELIAGRKTVWLPQRWRAFELTGPRQERFIGALVKLIKRLERRSRPRMVSLFHRRATDIVFGVLVLAGTAGAFLAPPFSGLDTLPALGVVGISLGVILEDALVVAGGILIAAAGIGLELALGAAAFHGIASIL